MYRPTTNSELWHFIDAAFGVRLPRRAYTSGHSSPFGFVADAFFHPAQDIAAWACRSGGKTLGASLIAAMEFGLLDGLQARALSGSEDQAKNLYEYWAQWANTSSLRHRLDSDVTRTRTDIAGGKFEILAASAKRVRGGKVHRLYRDEEDEIAPDIIGASVGMLASRNDHPSRLCVTSTWHHPGGPMGQLIDKAEAANIRLHKWNIWEAIATCPPERHDHGTSCVTCPLGQFCVPKAQQYYHKPRRRLGLAADVPCGLIQIKDAIRMATQWSAQQWEAEAECKRPSLDGLVYPQFDASVHVIADLDFDDDLPTYRSIDWGINDFVCLWFQVTKGSVVRVVDEYHSPDTQLADHAREILKRDKGTRIEATYCDPAGASKNDQTGLKNTEIFKSLGIPCQYKTDRWSKDVHNGVQMIRAALQPAAGRPRLFIAGACKGLIRAFQSYKLRQVNGEWIDEPVKPQAVDHWLDAIRYGFTNRMSTRKGGVKQLGFTG